MAKLNNDKVTNLVGSVVSDDGGTTIVALSASVSSDRGVATTYTESITNSNLYYSEIESVRKAIDDFNKEKRKLEDEMLLESPVEEDTEEEEEVQE